MWEGILCFSKFFNDGKGKLEDNSLCQLQSSFHPFSTYSYYPKLKFSQQKYPKTLTMA